MIVFVLAQNDSPIAVFGSLQVAKRHQKSLENKVNPRGDRNIYFTLYRVEMNPAIEDTLRTIQI